ncbi:uncharacterized protein LOC131251016 [Magnolia sinica]|uniref:uncharacterized protein LOC131251016 n=1 Tax=Magnolia sinica TaxID=86752 RepID=UPI00265932C2|nr:uncharacterized protein LOC131251016 [Magnolia sinica]
MVRLILIISSLVALATIQAIQAVEYEVTNNAIGTPGGTRFENEIGIAYSKQILETGSTFIWQTFRQGEADRKNVQRVSTFIRSMDGVAYTSNNEIHVSANYIAGYSGDVRNEITGVLYHELVHVWQWNGNGQTPGGLIEGIADFVRLKAGFAPSHWVRPGQGDRWDQGYDVTARFLDYCNDLKDGFVADLNSRMRTSYSPNIFVDLLGKTVDQLWNDYKARFGG